MPRKSKAKASSGQNRTDPQVDDGQINTETPAPGIQEIPKEEPEAVPEEQAESTLLQMFFAKIASIPPIRLILFVLTIVYLVKNYMLQREGYVPPPLPADHEERMAEQRQKDIEKYWMYGKYITVSAGLYLTMLTINQRQERRIAEQREKQQTSQSKKTN